MTPPRTVLLSGACGSGKTAIARLGYRRLTAALLDRGDVFHITLDPSLDEIVRRVAGRGGDKTPEWLATHVAWMRARYEPWTCRIDNTSLTPSETVERISAEVGRGCGRLTGPFGGGR